MQYLPMLLVRMLTRAPALNGGGIGLSDSRDSPGFGVPISKAL
jgi:hypothetical protein